MLLRNGISVTSSNAKADVIHDNLHFFFRAVGILVEATNINTSKSVRQRMNP
jgi:hypothetical protein